MPRDFVLLSVEMPGDAVFRAAAAATHLGVPVSMTLDAGGLLARFHTPELDPLVTVLHPHRVPRGDEFARLLPVLPEFPLDALTIWWSDVVVPWGAAQDPGRRLAEELARHLGGHLVDLTVTSDG